MKWTPKWVFAKTINDYYLICHEDLRAIREKLKGTPHMKKSSSRCSWVQGKSYYLYDLEYLDILGFKPIKKVPDHLIY